MMNYIIKCLFLFHFLSDVKLLQKCSARGSGISSQELKTEETAKFTVHAAKGVGVHNIEPHVTDPDGQELPVDKSIVSSRIECRYRPMTCGQHTVDVTYGGQHIKDSPFTVNVVQPSKRTSKGDKRRSNEMFSESHI